MALMNTLMDNFSAGITANWSTTDNSVDPAKVFATSGQIYVGHAATSEYNALSTTASYNLTGNYAFTQVLDFGNQTITSHEATMSIYKDSSNAIWIVASGGLLSAFKDVAGVQAQVGASITLDTHEHRWYRIRESGGTIFWETSPDSRTWTTRWSLANPFVVTAVFVQLQSGCWQNESLASYAMFDNFNTPVGTKIGSYGLRPHPFSPGLAR